MSAPRATICLGAFLSLSACLPLPFAAVGGIASAGYADFGATKYICLQPSKRPAGMDASAQRRIDDKFAGMLRAKSFVVDAASPEKCAKLTLEFSNSGRTLIPVVVIERNDRWGSFQPPRPMPEDEALAWLAGAVAARLKPETVRS